MATTSKSETTKPNTNPSGASDEQIKKGELAGKVRGPDVDSSFHQEEYTDPQTGEPVEWTPMVHDVLVNNDGTTQKATDTYAQPSEESKKESKS